MADLKHLTLDVNGTRYAGIERGRGPLVMLCHGTFGGKQLMLPQVDHLSRFFRTVAFDWPGHAQSGFDPAGWTADDLVEDVAELVTLLGEEQAMLAGISQGGAVGMRVALKYPAKVRALVNMCGGPGGPPPPVVKLLNGFAGVLAEEPDEAIRRAAAVEFAAKHFHSPDFTTRHPDRFAAEIDLILSHPRESVRLIPGVPKSYVDISPRLGDIACPTLVLWAEFEGRPALGAAMAGAIPRAELVTISQAGHHVNVEAPDETSAALETFFRRIP